MDKDKINSGRRKRDLLINGSEDGIKTPIFPFIVLLILYLSTSIFLPIVASSGGMTSIFGIKVPMASLTGVFSSLGNICIILMVVLYRKLGYYVSLGLLAAQLPSFIMSIDGGANTSILPGFFTNTCTVIAITIIFLKSNRISKYQTSFRKHAVTDDLTGLPNRLACTEYINEISKREQKFSVVSVKIDNFRGINDTMGRPTGDKVLVELSKRWKILADSWPSDTIDMVARITANEFVIIISDYESQEILDKTINVYKEELERKMTVDDCDFYLTAHFGYAEYPTDTDKYDSVMICADCAMHEARRRSITHTVFRFQSEHLKEAQNFDIERKIRNALENNEVFFYLQPQYDMDRKLRGFEALARMRDSEGSFVSPGDFIPVAERSGLIDRIDLRVFTLAVEFLEKLLEKGDNDLVISFNVSVRHLMKNDFVTEIKSVLESHKVPADHLEIEITESVMIDSADKALQCIEEIKRMGMKVAIDDFGTGYSSLSYLNKIPADILKIDKSFIDVMNNSASSKQYVASIISIGHVLNLEVVSEGVESPDQIDTLKNNGCDYIQGFVWGRPLPPEEAEKLVV
ncbi:MAG: bifunctional diguanylate cyclase/phosphodiesterase [Clostridiales bacterium]|nr:bifunctional diguanylate cyclase/phosphodiesterase [Clostridiales bacterium]